MTHARTNSENAEALLEGLIAECHAMIRDVIRPGMAECDHDDRREYLASASGLMDSAVKLGDVVGRLRGNGATPEVRQRITVEKVQSLPDRRTKPVPQISAPKGEGDG